MLTTITGIVLAILGVTLIVAASGCGCRRHGSFCIRAGDAVPAYALKQENRRVTPH